LASFEENTWEMYNELAKNCSIRHGDEISAKHRVVYSSIRYKGHIKYFYHELEDQMNYNVGRSL